MGIYYFFFLFYNEKQRDLIKTTTKKGASDCYLFLRNIFIPKAVKLAGMINVVVVTPLLNPQRCDTLFSSIRAVGW